MAKETYQDTSKTITANIGAAVDGFVRMSKDQRLPFSRKWYDNNFFDDGFHYRYVHRTTNRIVDLSEKAKVNSPMRAIPKASRQLRGMANLLLSGDFVPVARPDNIDKNQYSDPDQLKQAQETATMQAKRVGYWLIDLFKEQEISTSKLPQMIILAGKHSVAWLQIWPDKRLGKICMQVRDAFDVFVMGNLTDAEDSPMMVIGYPELVSKIKANPDFDAAQLELISPDNKYACDEIKQAYLMAKTGNNPVSDSAVTLLHKEAYIKEYLNEDNLARIQRQKDGDRILTGKRMGDIVIRQVHVAGDIWLSDKYTLMRSYPLVPLQLEPGPLYQIAAIERFIPANKSLDVLVSRGEHYANTMTTGTWLKRKGESTEITNTSGVQMLEYESQAPTQGQMAPIPAYYFSLIDYMGQLIEEQGVSTSALGKIPKGVKANAAIESLKASEYSNLKIPLDQVKLFIKRVAQKSMEIADDYIITPQNVQYMDQGKPQYFDVIGKTAMELRAELDVPVEGEVTPISGKNAIDIEVETGLGFTPEGKRGAAKEVMEMLTPFVTAKLFPPEPLIKIIEQTLKTYQFGNTADIVEGLNQGMPGQTAPLSEDQITQMKIAVAEVLKDMGADLGANADQRITETKIGVVEALKDAGMLDKSGEGETVTKPPSQSMSFKDLPAAGKVQMAAQAGIELSEQELQAEEEAKQAEEAEVKDAQQKDQNAA